VLLYDAETGRPLAQFEANHLGQIRTGAATGLAVKYMTWDEPLRVCIIGSGFQAHTQAQAISEVRQVRQFKIWSRSTEKREAFAQELGGTPMNSAAEAVAGSDVIVTATSSKDPVLESKDVPPSSLICAAGSNYPNRRELPADLVRSAELVCDDLEACRSEAGDLLLALAEQDWQRATELKILIGGENGKAGLDLDRLRIFKSVGLGLEDVAAAAAVYERATLEGATADRTPARR
jgi:ornithine cyclodeaminase/alanine dehydrogenase-like protein (mu-crystallin family)